MAWVAPPTFVSGNALTAAQMNILGGDLNETAPAKFTAASQIFVGTGLNAGAARTPAGATYAGGGTDSTNSATYIALTGGAAVTVTTGTAALVGIIAYMSSNTAGGRSWMSYAVSAPTNHTGADSRAVAYLSPNANNDASIGAFIYHSGLTSGSNTFTNHFRATGGISSFTVRSIHVVPL